MTTKEKTDRGRPELNKEDRKSVVVQFRVTESESKKLEKAAAKKDKKLSEWLRMLALSEA